MGKVKKQRTTAGTSKATRHVKAIATPSPIIKKKNKKLGKISQKKNGNHVAEAPASPRASKRKLEEVEEKDDEIPNDPPPSSSHSALSKKKAKKDVEVSDDAEESGDVEDEEEESDEDVEDEDDTDSDDEDESNSELLQETGEKIDFDFEAFPMEAGDKEGIVNMLTQIFLRAEVDLAALADALIQQAPLGTVIGPSEDCDDEDNTTSNVVYGLFSLIQLEGNKDKWAKDLSELVLNRAQKYAAKETVRQFEQRFGEKIGFLINERMLHFPDGIAPPSFASLLEDLKKQKKPPSHFLFICKIRVLEDEEAKKEAPPPPQQKGQKKKKLGKAAKKRLAAEALKAADIDYDNPEDEILFKLPSGSLVSFDYPVHTDVEAGSKFHVIKEGAVARKPYRRAAIMDLERLKAFLEAVSKM